MSNSYRIYLYVRWWTDRRAFPLQIEWDVSAFRTVYTPFACSSFTIFVLFAANWAESKGNNGNNWNRLLLSLFAMCHTESRFIPNDWKHLRGSIKHLLVVYAVVVVVLVLASFYAIHFHMWLVCSFFFTAFKCDICHTGTDSAGLIDISGVFDDKFWHLRAWSNTMRMAVKPRVAIDKSANSWWSKRHRVRAILPDCQKFQFSDSAKFIHATTWRAFTILCGHSFFSFFASIHSLNMHVWWL